MKCNMTIPKQCKFHKKNLLKININCLKYPLKTWKKFVKKIVFTTK